MSIEQVSYSLISWCLDKLPNHRKVLSENPNKIAGFLVKFGSNERGHSAMLLRMLILDE